MSTTGVAQWFPESFRNHQAGGGGTILVAVLLVIVLVIVMLSVVPIGR